MISRIFRINFLIIFLMSILVVPLSAEEYKEPLSIEKALSIAFQSNYSRLNT